jgi:DNA-binding GntR family transcriptional regulator
MTNFAGVPRGTLADHIYAAVRAAILNGGIREGTELNQVELAKEFQVSRVPVREALQRLQAERLITVTPYQQYVVRRIDPAVLVELLDLRAELEVFAVKRRMIVRDDAYINRLRELNLALKRQKDTEQWFLGDIQFHAALNGENTEAARIVRDIREQVHRHLRTVASSRQRQAEACVEHERIIDRIADGDEAGAEDALRTHINHTRTVIVDYLRTNHPDVFAALAEVVVGDSAG